MKRWIVVGCLLLVGCGVSISADRAGSETAGAATEGLPPDLRTRKTGEDWPAFLGPNHDSTSPEKGLQVPWPAGGPRIVWQKEVGIGYAMPSVSRGRLFLFDRVRNTARLQVMKAETAEPLWKFEYATDYRDKYGYNGGPRCCPVVDGDRVYLFGPEGMLHCLRVRDGKLLWKRDTTAEFGVVQNFFGVGSTPVVEGDLLLTMVGGSPPGSETVAFEELKGNGSAIVAFDKFTGKTRYQVGNELASYASPVVRTLGKRRYGLFFARGGLVGIDPASGKIEFTYPWRANMLESVNASNPVVVGSRLLLTECYELGGAVLDLEGGKLREVWTDRERPSRVKSMRAHWMTPIVVDGYAYVSSGRHRNEAELRCVEVATGKVVWREPGLTRSSLLLVDGHFVCLGEDGYLRLVKVNPRKYEEVSAVLYKDSDGQPLLEEPCWAAPILSNGLLFLRSERRLVCVELIPVKK